jgi:hypothetical protein
MEEVHGGRKRLFVTIVACALIAPGRCPRRVSSHKGLLRQALDRVGAEPRVFVSDLPRFLVLIRTAPRLDRVKAVKSTNGDARASRRPLQHKNVLSTGDKAAARRFYRGLGNGKVLFQIGVQVADADFGDDIGGRPGRGMEALNGGNADRQTRQQREPPQIESSSLSPIGANPPPDHKAKTSCMTSAHDCALRPIAPLCRVHHPDGLPVQKGLGVLDTLRIHHAPGLGDSVAKMRREHGMV